MVNNILHFSKASATYNGIFSIATTHVDNGRGNHFENIYGDAALKINGTMYSFFRHANVRTRGGIGYFTFDNTISKPNLTKHVNSINDSNQNEKHQIDINVAQGNIHKLIIFCF
jgi:hypothetical protein